MVYDVWLILFAVAILICCGGSFLWAMQSRKLNDLRKNLQISKRQTEDMAQFLIRNPYPFIQISTDGRIIFANPAAYAQYGGLGREGVEHIILSGLLERMARNGGRDIIREITCDDKTWAQMVVPVMSSGRAAYAVYCYDVTERKEFENMLEASQQLAEAANQAKSDFLANMSHELRTPMNGIIGLSGILAKMNLGAEAQELSGAVHHSARNLLTLLNDILDFSKIEAGELSLENIPFDMRAMVDQVVRLQENVATSKHLTLNAHIASDVPHYLMGDPTRLQQILNNLVSNALKFTDTGAVDIYVGATYIKDDVCHMHISVHDTGIGIADDQQDAVFKKFTQADISTSRKYGGTGLGLTITRQLVGMMGGTITLQSKVGEGTIFDIKISLPLASQRVNIQNIEQPKTLAIHRDTRILIVDDHPVNLLFMRRILGSFGVQNITDAKSGRE